jgi:hypothetical protein
MLPYKNLSARGRKYVEVSGPWHPGINEGIYFTSKYFRKILATAQKAVQSRNESLLKVVYPKKAACWET